MESAANATDIQLRATYTQVKVSVDCEIASAFKEACAASNVSMAAELSRFMVDYSGCLVKRKVAPDYTTRRRRRTAIKTIIKQLEQIKANEETSLNNMPENLQSSEAYDVAEEAVASLEEAIEVLNAFWMVP